MAVDPRLAALAALRREPDAQLSHPDVFGQQQTAAPQAAAAPSYLKPQAKPRPRPKVDASSANDAAIMARIAAKVTRSPVLGVPEPDMIPMAQLAQLGFDARPNEQGIPYGLQPALLNDLERRWLMRRGK
jgi:hypothetical protein